MEKQSLDKTIAIFGCGWLGLPLGASLVRNGYSVIGTTTRENRYSILKEVGITPCTYHLGDSIIDSKLYNADAAIVCIPSKDVDAFRFLVESISKSNIKHLIFVSSTSVYHSVNCVVTEESILNNSPLIEIEALFTQSKSFQSTILRFSGLMGPNRHPGRFFIDKPIPNPEGVVNFIHLQDCIGIIQAILNLEAWNEVFHAAADTHPNREHFYKEAKALLDLPSPKFIHSNDINSGKIISNQKLKTALNYVFLHPDLIQSLKTFE